MKERHLKETSNTLPPFYFLVVFWDKKHRGYFVDLSLPSLLAENNIPALENREDARFLICTTRADWEALREEAVFKLLSSYVQPVFIEMPAPDPEDHKMRVMSRGHKLLTEHAFQARACAINLNPDTLFADGAIAELQRLARAGKTLVFHNAIRFELEGVERELEEKGYLKRGEPLRLPPREAVAIGLRHMHSELLACSWEAPYFWNYPVHCWWNVPREHGILIYSFSWAPVLVNYTAIDEHNTETFEEWTLDGDYIYSNFKHASLEKDIHVVTDSDSMFLLSVTPKEEATVDCTPRWLTYGPVIGRWTKTFLINKVYNDDRIDPLKKAIYFLPVRIHSSALSPRWAIVERRSRTILERYLAPRAPRDQAGRVHEDEALPHSFLYIVKDPKLLLLVIPLPLSAAWFPLPWARLVLRLVSLSRRLWAWARWGTELAASYTRVVVRAAMGERTEQARIKRRVGWLGAHLRKGLQALVAPEPSEASRPFWIGGPASGLVVVLRGLHRRIVLGGMGIWRRVKSRLVSVTRSDPLLATGHVVVLRIPIGFVFALLALPRQAWNALVCRPYTYWSFLRPYLRVFLRATRGDRGDQQRIKRRLQLIVLALHR